jgi:hypothetical protein
MDPIDRLFAEVTENFEMKNREGNIVIEQMNGVVTWHHAKDIKLLWQSKAVDFCLQDVFHPDCYALQINNSSFEVQRFADDEYSESTDIEVTGMTVIARDNINRVTAAE